MAVGSEAYIPASPASLLHTLERSATSYAYICILRLQLQLPLHLHLHLQLHPHLQRTSTSTLHRATARPSYLRDALDGLELLEELRLLRVRVRVGLGLGLGLG